VTAIVVTKTRPTMSAISGSLSLRTFTRSARDALSLGRLTMPWLLVMGSPGRRGAGGRGRQNTTVALRPTRDLFKIAGRIPESTKS
jgi:hypothetical protein